MPKSHNYLSSLRSKPQSMAVTAWWVIVGCVVLLLSGCIGAPSPTNRPSLTPSATDAATEEATENDTEPTTESTAEVITTAGVIGNPTTSELGEEPTATPTGTRQGASSEPTSEPTLSGTQIASYPIVAQAVSGDILGVGTIRLYAPNEVEQGRTILVELELSFDALAITPTPFGPVTLVPVSSVTPTPAVNLPSPTPRNLRGQQADLNIYQRMSASLLCLPASFEGCDEPDTLQGVKNVRLAASTTWRWIILPRDGVRGLQDLSVELLTLIESSDGAQTQSEWSFSFQVNVIDPSQNPLLRFIENNLMGVLILVIGGLSLGVIGVFVARPKGKAASAQQTSGNINPSKKPTAFVSYRRRAGWVTARAIHDRLTEKGADVFIDIDDINEGRFEEIITNAIENREYFILILSPDTWESEWVIKETLHAMSKNKKIIPVLIDGFALHKDKLPDELASLKSHNAVTLTPEYFNAGIDRIANFMGIKPDG
jgi:hypothetical protein